MLFPGRVLPSAGMWNLNLFSIMFDLKISLITRANSLKTIQTTEIQYIYILSFDLVNVVPCSVKKTTVTGCPCRSETYCNGGHWRTCQDGVFGLTGSLDRWKHKQKPWNLDDFNEVQPDPPLRTLAKSFGARCSQMTTQITPIRESHGPCRETSEKRVRTATIQAWTSS